MEQEIMVETNATYLKKFTELGELEDIVATEDICNAAGVKLLSEGAPINRKVRNQLIQHKLLKPIDHSAVVKNAVGYPELIADAQSLMESKTQLGLLLRTLRQPEFAAKCVHRIDLEPVIRNKLTVARTIDQDTLQHCLRVAMMTTLIGEQLGVSEQELEVLATAGLLHDIGEIHVDVGHLGPDQPLSPEHWRQLRAHPIIGASVVDQLPTYEQAVSRAILEHHERLDGSGYPYRRTAVQLSRAGRILAFVDLAIGAAQKFSLSRVFTIVKANQDKLDPDSVTVFLHFLKRVQQKNNFEQLDKPSIENIRQALELYSKLTVVAGESATRCNQTNESDQARFMDYFRYQVELIMTRAGIDLHQCNTQLACIEADTDALHELLELLGEVAYQVRMTVYEIRRQWTAETPETVCEKSLHDWVSLAEQSLEEITNKFADCQS